MKRWACVIAAVCLVLSSCGVVGETQIISGDGSVVESEVNKVSNRMYDDLSIEEKDMLERAGLQGEEGSELTHAQCYVLDGVSDMLAYIENKYQQKFTVHYFHSMSINESYDTLYVFPEGLDKGLDIVTVKRVKRKADKYEYTDNYAAVYCRPTLESLMTEFFITRYGENRAKLFMTMRCDESYSFDGKEDPEELLRKHVAWGHGVMFLSEGDISSENLESILEEYGEDFQKNGIESSTGVYLMKAEAFDNIRYSNYETMIGGPEMVARYRIFIYREEVRIQKKS